MSNEDGFVIINASNDPSQNEVNHRPDQPNQQQLNILHDAQRTIQHQRETQQQQSSTSLPPVQTPHVSKNIRGQDAHLPQPTHPVGSNNVGSLPPSLAAMLKVFREPKRNIASAIDSMRIERGTSQVSYADVDATPITPLTYVDPARPVRIFCDEASNEDDKFDSQVPDIPVSIVSVVHDTPEATRYTALTAKAQDLQARSNASVNDSATLASYTPRAGLINSAPQRRVLSQSDYDIQTCADEATLMRAYALMMMRAPPELLAQSTHLHSELQFLASSYSSCVTRWTTSWTEAEIKDQCDGKNIPVQAHLQHPHDRKVICRVLDLDEMLAATSADEAPKNTSRDKDGKLKFDKAIEGELFIPVYYEWLNDTSIVPYIMAHTSSSWYQGAAVLQMKLLDSRLVDKTKKVKVEGILEPSLYVIPGTFKRITLVVVDVVSDSALSPFMTLAGYFPIKDRFAGEDISPFFMNQLGRYTPADNPVWKNMEAFNFNDCHTAVKRITSLYHTPESATLVRSKAVSLFGSIPMGHSVWTGGPGDKKVDSLTSKPMMFNVADTTASNKIAGRVKPISPSKWADAEAPLTTASLWRVDAMGMFHKSQVAARLTKGTSHFHYPSACYAKKNEPDHTLVTMTNKARILCGLRLVNIGCSEVEALAITFSNPYRLFKHIQAQAALQTGVTNWFLAESGTTVPDLNGLTSFRDSQGNIPALKVISMLTSNWINNRPSKKTSLMMDDVTRKLISKYLTYEENLNFYNRWFTGFCPLYYVSAIIDKFDVQVTYNSGHYDTSTPLDTDMVDDDGNYSKAGFISSRHTSWYDTALMCSSMSYERMMSRRWNTKPLFKISMPDAKGLGTDPGWMGWYPRSVIDLFEYTNLDFGSSGGSVKLDIMGICETLIMICPSSRNMHTRLRDWTFVTDVWCHVKRDDPSTFIRVSDLYLPDPAWEWIYNGLKVALPSLIRGDIIGAVATFGGYALDSAVDWLRANFDPEHYASGN